MDVGILALVRPDAAQLRFGVYQWRRSVVTRNVFGYGQSGQGITVFLVPRRIIFAFHF